MYSDDRRVLFAKKCGSFLLRNENFPELLRTSIREISVVPGLAPKSSTYVIVLSIDTPHTQPLYRLDA